MKKNKNQLEITTDGITSLYEFLDDMEIISLETPEGFKITFKAEFHRKTGESCKGDKK